MCKKYQLFIDGKYCEATAGRTFETACPATNQTLGHVPSGTVEDVDKAAKSAAQAFEDPDWRDMDVTSRVDLLGRAARLIMDRQDELSRLETLDTGNPITITEKFIAGAAGCLEFFPPLAYHLTGEQIPISPQRLDYTAYEPLGVVALIVPWNDPLEIACGKLAAALATGNTCVLKPSPLAPLTGLLLGEIFLESGLPPGVVNIVTGLDDEVGTALINHPLIQMISFTGSVATGQIIQEAAAKTTKRVTLEMGGKSANIVFPDADLSKAIPGAAQAIYRMSGQNCMAGSRLFLHQDIYDHFLAGLLEESKGYRVGDPLNAETMMGPLISRSQLEKVKRYVACAQEEGAKLVLGGQEPSDPKFERGNYFLPTILTGVRPSMKIAREEIFGPVLCIFGFSSEEEVVCMANDTHYGLGAGFWTRDLSVAHRLARFLQAGTVYINTFSEFYYQAPTGGYKRSGLGSEYGLDFLKQYVQRKNVVIALN